MGNYLGGRGRGSGRSRDKMKGVQPNNITEKDLGTILQSQLKKGPGGGGGSRPDGPQTSPGQPLYVSV